MRARRAGGPRRNDSSLRLTAFRFAHGDRARLALSAARPARRPLRPFCRRAAGQSCQRTADEIGCGAAAGASEPASAERKYVARLVPAGLNVVGLGGGGSGLGTDGSSTPHGASSLGYNTPTLNQAAEQLSAQADEPRAPGAPSPPKRGYESAFATGNDGAAGVARGGAKGSRARARFASAAGEAASSGARGGARSVERFAPDSAGARCMPTSALATQALTAEAVRGLRRALNISPAPVQAVGAPAAEGALAVARPGQPRFDGGGTSAQPHSQGAAAELAAMHAAASPWSVHARAAHRAPLLLRPSAVRATLAWRVRKAGSTRAELTSPARPFPSTRLDSTALRCVRRDSYPLLALSNPLLSLATAAMHPGRISPPAAEHALAADAGATDALASHA